MEAAYIDPRIFTAAGIVAVIITALIIVLVRRARRPRKFKRGTEVLLGVLVLVMAAVGSGVTFQVQQGIMYAERLASIEKTYGIRMDVRDLIELRAPRGAPPEPKEGEISTFGATQVVQDGKVITMYLAYDGKNYTLHDPEGTQLPRVG